ncbi:MAG: hypothetical protein AAF773_20400 [Cyanobacteria bacterium P01_D01_bin.115]
MATVTACVDARTTASTEGQNTVLIGHDDGFDAATDIYPEPQGVAYVVRPNGQRFELVANLNPDEWAAQP